MTQQLSKHSRLESLAALMGSTHRSLLRLSHGLRAQYTCQDVEKYFLNVDTHICPCTSVLYFLISQGWCWGPHFIVMGYTQVLLTCRPAHCLGTSDAWKTSRPNAKKWLQRGGWCGKSKVAMHRVGLWPERRRRASQRSSTSAGLWTHTHSLCQSRSVPGKEVQVHVREQNCSCLQQDRFSSYALLILTLTSNS